jgi:hypothetical protein
MLPGGGLMPPAWYVGEDAKERAFSSSVKKNRPPGCRERKWTEERLQPTFIFSFFPRIQRKKDREKRNIGRGNSFANMLQQYFGNLIFGTNIC